MPSVLLKPKSLTWMYGILAATFIASSSYANMPAQKYPSDLNAALDYYGFKTAKQKQALRYLMKKADIKNADTLLDKKAANKDELGKLILDFVRETQDKFTVRSGKQERWEVQTPDWMKNSAEQEQILSALETLDMTRAVEPAFIKPDAICILGSTRSGMVSRLNYAGELLEANKLSANWLIMLAGERYVTPDKNGNKLDGNVQELEKLAAKSSKNVSQLTETDLMKAAYESSSLYGKFLNKDVLIDTPRRGLPRPTTETTVKELCGWLKQHPDVREIVFVSDQPHVAYQQAIIEQVFEKEEVRLKFETIGPKCNAEKFNNKIDKLYYILQALGSRVWAETPTVMRAIGFNIADPNVNNNLKSAYMALYEKQPLIYNNLKAESSKVKL